MIQWSWFFRPFSLKLTLVNSISQSFIYHNRLAVFTASLKKPLCFGIYYYVILLLSCRSQVETVSAERDALKENLAKFTEEKEMLIVESEDTAQKLEKQHEAKLR